MANRTGKPVDPRRMERLLALLDEHYPESETALSHQSPMQLLVATILSAQCTDARVNLVTPALFRKYPDAPAFARANLRELEALIRSTGFFRSKARNIRECCRKLVKDFAGEVPPRLADLVTLPGVGRKTANVVLGNSFGIPGITVDTHVGRVSRRLGLTRHEDPVKVEFDLMKLVPESRWSSFSLQLILHGRQICISRRPRCEACFLRDSCPYSALILKGRAGPRPRSRKPALSAAKTALPRRPV
jgi:endonuclease-3